MIATPTMKVFSPALNLSSPLRLRLGPGPGARLLSPGAPDEWIPHRGGLAWLDAQGAFFLWSSHAIWLPLPGVPVSMVPWGVEHLAIAVDIDGALLWLAVGPDHTPMPDPSKRAWFSLGPRTIAAPGVDGRLQPPPLPDGAETALKSPLWGRPGLAWVDEGTLYRGLPGRVIRVAGSVSFTPQYIRPGPNDAQLLIGDDTYAFAGPSSPPFEKSGCLEPYSFRFAANGRSVLGSDEDGPTRLGESMATDRSSCPEGALPLGTDEAPWWFVPELGDVGIDGAAASVQGAFATAWARDTALLVGPAGAIWDLDTARPIAQHPGLCGEHITIEADQIRVVSEDHCRIFSREGDFLAQGICSEAEPEDSEPCTIEREAGRWELGWDGLALWCPRDATQP